MRFLLCLPFLFALPALPQSITVTAPSAGDRIASGGDFATDSIGDPWDMDQSTDFSAYVLGFQSYSFAGGLFSGLTDGTGGANIQIQYEGEANTNHYGREGVFFPIDSAKYRNLSLRLYSDKAGFMRFLYFRKPGTLTDTSTSNYVKVLAGWNLYDIDLVSLGGSCATGSNCSFPGYGGTILGLRLDPNNTPSSTIKIDWIRLRAGDTSATTFHVRWQAVDPSGNGIVDLYSDDNQNPGDGFIDHFASQLPASSGSFDWPVNRMDPAPYYVYAVLATTYAEAVLRDPWDMSQSSDVTFANWTSAGVASGTFSGVSKSATSAVYPRLDTRYPIRASAFRYVKFRMDVSQQTFYRVVWKPVDSTQRSTTATFQATPGMKNYSIDLAAYPEWTGMLDELRLNPVSAGGIQVTIDSIELSSVASSSATTSDYSAAPLKVNEVPQIFITDPDISGGEDFATTILQNPWDMSDAADVPHTSGVTNTSFSGGMFHATSVANNPAVFPFYGNGPNIDAAKYHLFTVAYQVDATFDVPLGSVSRILWRPDLQPATPESVTQDFLAYPGYHILTADLSTVLLENNPPYNLPIPWQGTEAELRFDPDELPGQVTFHIDYVKLATEDASDGTFLITWQDSDQDSSATLDLFFDTDNNGFDGTAIATGIPEDDPSNSFSWQSAAAPQGPIWIYGRITDGLDSVARYATGVLINNAVDTVPPYLTLLDPDRSDTGIPPAATITGHVRDASSGVDLASLVVRVNGSTVGATVSGNSSDAVYSYQPGAPFGFGQTVTVNLTAKDTAGNNLSDTYSFTITTSTDSDGDGMPDQFETHADLDPFDNTSAEGASGDPDLDGVANLTEYQSGTDPTSWAQFLVGPGPGPSNPPTAKAFYRDGTPVAQLSIAAYGVSKFGVNVAAGSIETKTSRAVVTGPGPGGVFGPQVKGFRRNAAPISKVNFFAYGTLRFGVHAATGDVDGEGYEEILSSPGRGDVFGPHVRGWNYDGAAIKPIAKINFFAYKTLRWGAHAASGDLEADGFDEILTAPGPGQIFGPQVRGFNYDGGSLGSINKVNFMAVSTTEYGAFVAGGDVERDGFDEILAGPGPGPSTPASLRGYDYDGVKVTAAPGLSATPYTSMYGLVPGAGDLDGDRTDEVIAGAGASPSGTSGVKSYDYTGSALVSDASFTAYPGLAYGVTVAAGRYGY